LTIGVEDISDASNGRWSLTRSLLPHSGETLARKRCLLGSAILISDAAGRNLLAVCLGDTVWAGVQNRGDSRFRFTKKGLDQVTQRQVTVGWDQRLRYKDANERDTRVPPRIRAKE
jgi:hypothetical protein